MVLAGCRGAPRDDADPPPRRVTQFSVINALMLGDYDGVFSIGDVLEHGDFGVGTLDHLDGELIVLDGRAYQVNGEGRVLDAGSDRKTPFATVVRFVGDGSLRCPAARSLAELDAFFEQRVPHANSFVAVRVEGRFETLTLRSVARQEPPYRSLSEVAKEQAVWHHEKIAGTLVGIRTPAWAHGLNVTGTHWHFLSNDRRVGGHVLDCRIEQAASTYQVCTDWLVRLDDRPEFDRLDLGRDMRSQVSDVESARGVGE
jgi:acetolactate decarboxylase